MDDETMLLDAARRHDERIRRQLEQLVKEVIVFLEVYKMSGPIARWVERAKALIAQEV